MVCVCLRIADASLVPLLAPLHLQEEHTSEYAINNAPPEVSLFASVHVSSTVKCLMPPRSSALLALVLFSLAFTDRYRYRYRYTFLFSSGRQLQSPVPWPSCASYGDGEQLIHAHKNTHSTAQHKRGWLACSWDISAEAQ